ncbi:MAG: hypothetical protein ACC628_04350 [Pirellulaceae bacterium]
MAEEPPKVNLLRFTFHSLYFCGTQVEVLRGDRFLTAVNHWYLPFIRAGFAVPLAFIIDISTLLQRPSTGFKSRWNDSLRDDVKQLTRDYYRMLQRIRRQPIFTSVVELLAETPDRRRHDQAIRTFLRFLLAELSQFRTTYAFDSRNLSVLSAQPTPQGIRDLKVRFDGKPLTIRMPFIDPTHITGKNEFGTIVDIMRDITEYYSTNFLQSFISDEERLIVELAARSPSGVGRVDYRFLSELLSRSDLAGVDEQEPRPRMVDQITPTDSYETDGNVGGYIDVNRRRFSGSLAEVLPVEMSLFNHRWMMLQKLLNDGALHFVRENIEHIEEELRVLICFVVDASERMMRSPDDLHPLFGKGMTPYVRARALAALSLRDLATYFPREKVKMDFGLYLWSTKARQTYRTEFEPFQVWQKPAEAADRFRYSAKLSAVAPYLFDNRVSPEAARANIALDRDPGRFVVTRSQARHYHCRHMVFFTSRPSVRDVVPEADPRLRTYDVAGDSVFEVHCDVQHTTVGMSQLDSVADLSNRSGTFGELSEERLRFRILETMLMKAAGKTKGLEIDDTLGDIA